MLRRHRRAEHGRSDGPATVRGIGRRPTGSITSGRVSDAGDKRRRRRQPRARPRRPRAGAPGTTDHVDRRLEPGGARSVDPRALDGGSWSRRDDPAARRRTDQAAIAPPPFHRGSRGSRVLSGCDNSWRRARGPHDRGPADRGTTSSRRRPRGAGAPGAETAAESETLTLVARTERAAPRLATRAFRDLLPSDSHPQRSSAADLDDADSAIRRDAAKRSRLEGRQVPVVRPPRIRQPTVAKSSRPYVLRPGHLARGAARSPAGLADARRPQRARRHRRACCRSRCCPRGAAAAAPGNHVACDLRRSVRRAHEDRLGCRVVQDEERRG